MIAGHGAPAAPGPDNSVLAQTVAFHRDPLGFLREAQGRHGDVFTIRLLTARPLLVVAAPGAVEELLASDPERAGAGAARRKILPFASERSVFGGDAATHRAARARIAPALSAEALAGQRPEMERLARQHAAELPRGRPFRLLPKIRALTDEIFVRLVLGVGEEPTASRLIDAIQRMLRTPGNPPLTLPGPGDGAAGVLGRAIFERRQAPVLRQLNRAIEARRAAQSGRGAGGGVLGRVVAAEPERSNGEIADELMSLLMAAQEPPAIALTWLIDRLGREPALAARFQEEPDGEMADAILRETVRLQPPASAVLRRLTEPIESAGHLLPAGATVLLPTSLLHRDPRVFADPDSFVPERWLTGDTATAAFFPFGGGARRCVGEPLAQAEIASVVPAMLAEGAIKPIAPEPERMVQRATVLVPQRGLLANRNARRELTRVGKA